MFKKHIKKTMSMILSLGIAVGGVFAVPSIPIFADGEVAINDANFPDATFRQYVSDNFDTDATKGVLSVTELNAVTEIDLQDKGITSLKGVEYFTKLKYLTCTYGTFTSVDVSKNTELISLTLYNNNLTSINVRNNKNLQVLHVSWNQLTGLDVSQNSELRYLYCEKNNLTGLSVSDNKKLEGLGCSYNPIKILDVSQNTNLMFLECRYNELTSLNINNNGWLYSLDCSDNQISSLNVSNNTKLTHLCCQFNKISSLDLSNTPLKASVNDKLENISNTTYRRFGYDANGDVVRTLWHDSNVSVKFTNSSNNNGNTSNNTNKSTNKNTTKETKKYSNEWVDGKWYNADGSQTYKGTMKWKCNSKGWWIEDSAGWYPKSQWQKIDGKWYYFCSDGYMDYSEYRDGCWLGSDGAWVESYSGGKWYLDSTGWWYSDSSGWYPANQWLWIDGTNYHFNAKGYCTNP